ncbi:UDP-N-acetylmuramoyl-L-alanyl-D-glutamate--2,6-diaminopimelate ligase 1 [Endomicrobiia bacterium]|nr:UDP-N-acetylmuramoyl-L-alanyl-D-glutamate--2,6-diaminopimelate ligase 1 [Endomicrobiia bacterium]
MKLKEILLDLSVENMIVLGNVDIHVSGVSYDSRTVGKDYVFFALPGHNTNGSKYIDEAVKRSASVIINTLKSDTISVTQIVVDDIFMFMSVFCAKFYNYPDRELNVIGITGTNGKTTITYMIESIFANSGIECGVTGTVNYRYKNKIIEAANTTPQSLDIYKIMREMVDNGIKHLAMEVSSHALSLGRVHGIDFDMAIFTNLTQDHLDFHKNMNSYFEAKSMLFRGLGAGTKRNKKYAIINVDDKHGKKLSETEVDAEIKLYSTVEKNRADFKAENVEITGNGSKFDLIFNDDKAKISIKHIGLHNVYNALAALAASVCSGITFNKAVEGLGNSKQAPGRLESINATDIGFDIIIDYAHTDDALKNVLQTIKKIKPKRIIAVFGCGGDRDRAKRPLMGKTAVEMSDFVFVTSDNPRTEDPNKIILDIEVGIKRVYKTNYKVVVSREEAIKEAVIMADKGDILLIAGKGHEGYQIIGSEKIHFNDIEVAKKYIELKNAPQGVEQKEFTF